MKMIWQLFSVHIIVISTILFLLIVWLIFPRRFVQVRKVLLRLNGLFILTSILLAAYTYWPYQYDKAYLKNPISEEIKSTPLRTLADSIDFYVGVATSAESDYASLVSQQFNSIVAENHFKPGKLLKNADQWEFDFTQADKLVEFSNSNNMRLRGHTLIWGKFAGRTYPKEWVDEIKKARNKEEKMKELITRYINAVMGHFKGQVPTWDVVNEPMGGAKLFPSIFTQTMGEKYIDLAFNLAHKTDPDCSLFLNEQIIDYNGPQGEAFLELLKRLIDRNVPIHGVGLQTHHINRIHPLKDLKAYIQKIAALGLKIEITELDIRLLLFDDANDPYAAQGEQYEQIVKICLDDPACQGVTFWGLTDAGNWMDGVPPFKWKSPNSPNIYDEDMNMKPAYVGIWESLKAAN